MLEDIALVVVAIAGIGASEVVRATCAKMVAPAHRRSRVDSRSRLPHDGLLSLDERASTNAG
jgi:hypothetical protein